MTGKIKADALFGDSAVMLKTTVESGGALDGKSMQEVKQYFCNKILIGTVRRNKKIWRLKGY